MRIKIRGISLANIMTPFVIIAAAMLITSALIMTTGANPLNAYYHLLTGVFSNIIDTINRTVPIAFTAFAVALGIKVGLFNIGLESQFLMGSLASAAAGAYITGLPSAMHVPLCLIVGMLSGMLYALPVTAMFVGKGANLLVLQLLFNSIGTLICTYFIAGPFAGENPAVAAMPRIQATAQLPNLINGPNKLSISILFVILVAFAIWFYLNKTTGGYQLRAVGDNADAARYAGINVKKYHFWVLLAGGGLAGFAGALDVTGNFYRMYGNYSPGYGFDGIPIAMLANGNPLGMVIGAIVFGALRVGSVNMQAKAGVSVEIVKVIQGVLIMLISAQHFVRFLVGKYIKNSERSGKA